MKREEFCPNCEEYRETKVVQREETYTVRDRQITVSVKAETCSSCGESIGSDEADQEVLDAVHAEFRRQADLLTPERIKQIRKRYRLSQRSLAALLGMSEATINRYEQGGLQDQAHDTAIRACDRPEIVRDLLERRGHLLTDWQRKRAEQALAGVTEPDGSWLDLIGQGNWIQLANEVSDRTGFRRFDHKRFASVVLWFCGRLGRVYKTQINKLLFYGDFLNFKTATVSLTGTAYRKAPLGPVPTDYGKLLGWMQDEAVLVCREVEFSNGNMGFSYHVGPNAGPVTVEFAPHEQKVLEYVAEVLGGLTAKGISERSHQEPAWRDAKDGQVISYREAETLSLSLPG
ncbi:hypothetical protein LCGC14_2186020 [marine sediment metagenome]|uniref:HTH cro/C1-type domain-containing protein n=1 Tax=marine sediment metagenome TaxID=412755 RepID=A0A0F9FYD1_9ZZZZ